MNAAEEHQPLQRSEPAQCDIHLSGRKGIARIYDCFFKSEPLAFMDSDCPCQPYWVLLERAKLFFINMVLFLIIIIPDVFPGFFFNFHFILLAWKAHINFI